MSSKIYVRKLYEHDITHQISITKGIVTSFFDNKPSFNVLGGSSYKSGTATILLATDPRFGGDFKEVLRAEGRAETDDIIIIEKTEKFYILNLIKKGYIKYNFFLNLLGPNDRHKVFIPLADYSTEIESIIDSPGFSDTEKTVFLKKALSSKSDNRKILTFDEDIDSSDSINEGNETTAVVKRKKRSKKLRDAAVKYFTDDEGHIKCDICGFDFQKEFGPFGKKYIQIHHKKPVFAYENDDINKTIDDAIRNLVPLCCNCHAMVHKAMRQEYTYEAFKNYFKEYKNKLKIDKDI